MLIKRKSTYLRKKSIIGNREINWLNEPVEFSAKEGKELIKNFPDRYEEVISKDIKSNENEPKKITQKTLKKKTSKNFTE